jgi:hypothetical protein
MLTCSGAGGSASQTVVVTVTASPPPVVQFSATPPSVAAGGASLLTWSSTSSTACTASGAWNGARNINGTQSTGALTADTTYTLTCNGPGGSDSETVVVTILPAPSLTFTAYPTSVASGNASTLTWNATNATACTASGAWSGTRNTSGTQSTGALTTTSTYSLTCTGAGGSATQSVTIAILPQPAVTLTANPATVASGNASTLTWSSSNATGCMASGAWSGARNTSGLQSTGALTTTSTYTLTCTGAGGSANGSVTIVVTPLGSATVSWLAPTTNANGSTLTDLQGFRLYHGTVSGSYDAPVDIADPAARSYTFQNLQPGTHYFAVSAYDTSLNESALSIEVSKTL